MAAGLSREQAAVDLWLKDIAPSDSLRKWFGHTASRWDDFRNRYRGELSDPRHQEAIERIRRQSRAGPVTLLFSARDPDHNNAVALLDFLQERLRRVA